MKKLFAAAFLALAMTAGATADDWAMSASEVYEKMQQDGDQVLFIDVRDPVEIQFIGFTDMVDVNLPFRIVERTQWDEENNRFAMPLNETFSKQVEAALADKGLDREAMIITMCRSGSERGEPSAAYLRNHEFPNVYYVEHGFQGDVRQDGEQAGMRTLNGWQNEGLPWSPRANPDKIFRP